MPKYRIGGKRLRSQHEQLDKKYYVLIKSELL